MSDFIIIQNISKDKIKRRLDKYNCSTSPKFVEVVMRFLEKINTEDTIKSENKICEPIYVKNSVPFIAPDEKGNTANVYRYIIQELIENGFFEMKIFVNPKTRKSKKYICLDFSKDWE